MDIESRLENGNALLESFLGRENYQRFLADFAEHSIRNLSRREDVEAVREHIRKQGPIDVVVKPRDCDSSSALSGRGLVFDVSSNIGGVNFTGFAKIGSNRKGEARRSNNVIKLLKLARYKLVDSAVSSIPELEFVATPLARGRNLTQAREELSESGKEDLVNRLAGEAIRVNRETCLASSAHRVFKKERELIKKIEKIDYLKDFMNYFDMDDTDIDDTDKQVLEFYSKVNKALSLFPHGLIHADLNADNVIVDAEDGEAQDIKVVDWGSAKLGLPYTDLHRLFIGLGEYEEREDVGRNALFNIKPRTSIKDAISELAERRPTPTGDQISGVLKKFHRDRFQSAARSGYHYSGTKAWEKLERVIEDNFPEFPNISLYADFPQAINPDEKDIVSLGSNLKLNAREYANRWDFGNENWRRDNIEYLKAMFILSAANSDLILAGKTIQAYRKLSRDNEDRQKVAEVAGMYLRRGLENLELLSEVNYPFYADKPKNGIVNTIRNSFFEFQFIRNMAGLGLEDIPSMPEELKPDFFEIMRARYREFYDAAPDSDKLADIDKNAWKTIQGAMKKQKARQELNYAKDMLAQQARHRIETFKERRRRKNFSYALITGIVGLVGFLGLPIYNKFQDLRSRIVDYHATHFGVAEINDGTIGFWKNRWHNEDDGNLRLEGLVKDLEKYHDHGGEVQPDLRFRWDINRSNSLPNSFRHIDEEAFSDIHNSIKPYEKMVYQVCVEEGFNDPDLILSMLSISIDSPYSEDILRWHEIDHYFVKGIITKAALRRDPKYASSDKGRMGKSIDQAKSEEKEYLAARIRTLELLDYKSNIRVGVRQLKKLIEQEDKVEDALAVYIYGREVVEDAKTRIVPDTAYYDLPDAGYYTGILNRYAKFRHYRGWLNSGE